MALGAAAQLGGDELRDLVKRSRWIAVAGATASAGLLIADLGKPERFLNMLRVFRPTSPMSIGSWVLAGFGSLAGASAVLADSSGLVAKMGDTAGTAAGVLGLPLASYTAVLLSNTAVPVWQESRRILPILFLGSAMASAAGILETMPLGDRESTVVRTFGVAGNVMELASSYAIARQISRVKPVAESLHDGLAGTLWRTGRRLSIASLALSLLPGRSRKKHTAAGTLGSLASLCFKFSVFQAGKACAKNPNATFELQRTTP